MDDTAHIAKALGTLPRWDLTDLYDGPEAPALRADIEATTADAKALNAAHAGMVEAMDGAELAALVTEYERIGEVVGRIMSFAYLYYCTALEDPETGRFFQIMQEKTTDISSDLLFVTLEINRLEEAELAARLETASLAHYQPWLRDVRAYRAYQLSDELEKMLNDKQLTSSAWVRLFDETVARMRFPLRGKEMTSAEVLNLLSDTDPALRKEAAHAVGKGFGDNIQTFALITNTLAKDKEIEDRWRGFEQPISARNVSNRVEDNVVAALTGAVKSAYPSLSHRYYSLKARWFGDDVMDYWDRNAPLPDDDDTSIKWEDAVSTVLGAYRDFSPTLADIGQRFFDNAWIDAPVAAGKAPGAFAHPTVPSAHPYLLLNYQGKTRDVMTLAHELGHGVHQVLAAEQGPLMSDTPLTLAETASVFGEQLTFQALIEGADKKRRRVMLASKVEDMLNTVVRQVAFCEFERAVHDERRNGELTADKLGELWLEVQTDSLGPAIRFDDTYRNFWAYIPHFIHSPFYVYAYAFGDCLVNALYAAYQDAPTGFEARYLEMLRAGGTLQHRELLAPFGLDASDPGFWAKGLGIIEGFLDELETTS
jgi:oligoendopeptidase F